MTGPGRPCQYLFAIQDCEGSNIYALYLEGLSQRATEPPRHVSTRFTSLEHRAEANRNGWSVDVRVPPGGELWFQCLDPRMARLSETER